MAYCPQCGTEYEDFARECMDCHVALLTGMPPPDLVRSARPSDVQLKEVRAFTGGTAFTQADLAKNTLEAEGIPCIVSGANAARLLHSLDVRLLVREEDGEEADRILKEYSDSGEEPPDNNLA